MRREGRTPLWSPVRSNTIHKLHKTCGAIGSSKCLEFAELSPYNRRALASLHPKGATGSIESASRPLEFNAEILDESGNEPRPATRPSHGERSEGEEPAGGVGPGGWPQATRKDTGRAAGNVDTPSIIVGEPLVRRKSARLARRTAAAVPKRERRHKECAETEGARATWTSRRAYWGPAHNRSKLPSDPAMS